MPECFSIKDSRFRKPRDFGFAKMRPFLPRAKIGFVERFYELDLLRGLAVVAMILFHICFDLNYFTNILIPIASGIPIILARFAELSFISLVGISFSISYSRASKTLSGFDLYKKYLARGLWIFFLGMLITAFTFVFFQQATIWFGVLHMIGISVMILPLFAKFGKFNLALGSLIIIFGLILLQFRFDFSALFWLGFMPSGFSSLDYFPLLPWFGLALIGLFIGKKLYPDAQRSFKIPDFSKSLVSRFFGLLGRHSLFVYFIHQPVIFIIITLVFR